MFFFHSAEPIPLIYETLTLSWWPHHTCGVCGRAASRVNEGAAGTIEAMGMEFADLICQTHFLNI
jgi:hypothetical protein